MLLTPQHFQQWDRHRDALERDRSRTFQPFDWGLRELSIDPAALQGGELRILRCAGALPDGALFDAPGRDRLPAARSFAARFDPSAGRLAAYLAVPLPRDGASRVADASAAMGADGSASTAAYLALSASVLDETRDGSERQIRTAVPNLTIRFAGEPLDEYQNLAVAEIVRTDGGGYTLDERFLPPMTQIRVAPWLGQSLRGLVDMLAAKSDELAGQQRKTGGMAEATGFWLLHTVNTHLLRLLHLHRRVQVHPEALYLAMAELAAQLCTFARGSSPRSLPDYQHDDPRATFGALTAQLRDLLGTVVPTRCIALPLERSGETLFKAEVHDATLFTGAEFYLGVAADVEERRLVAEVPQKAKISSPDKVQQLLMMAVPGLMLRHVPSPPQDMPVQPGRVYFQLEKVGAHWEAITAAQAMSVHVPPGFSGLRLELLAIKL